MPLHTLIFASILLSSFGIVAQNVFADTTVTTIPVGANPLSVGVNIATNMIYVVNYDSSTVSVIDGSTNSVASTISVGSNPVHVAVNPITNKIYVSDSSGIQVIDGSTNGIIDTISIADSNLAVNSNTNMIYAANIGNGMFSVINGTTDTVVTTMSVSGRGGGVAVNPITNTIYEYSLGYSDGPTGYFIVIDGTTNTVLQSMKIGDAGGGVAVNSNTDKIYVIDNLAMYVIDGSTNAQIDTVKFAQPVSPAGIALNQNTNKIYVSDTASNTVHVIDGAINSVVSTIPVGTSPIGVGVNPNTDKIYVSNYDDGTITVIDGDVSSPTTSQLQVDSQDNNANPITDFYTELYAQNGTQIDTGYTPYNFTLDNMQNYLVHVEDYGKYMFDHWSDTGSTNSTRNISVSSDSTITAIYKTVSTPPTGLTATGKLLQINLSWAAPSDNGGSTITGYMIERSINSGSTWSTIVSNTNSASITYSDTHVLPIVTYTYRVSAINDVGTSDPSNTVSASALKIGLLNTPTLP